MAVINKIKYFFKEHKKLILFETIFILLYAIFAYKILNLVSHANLLFLSDFVSIFFSPEVFVTVIVGIAAIYSWLHQKKIKEYETDLQMLKDIDTIYDYYTKQKRPVKVARECRTHLESIESKYQESENFLITYLKYLDSIIIEPEDNGSDDNENQIIANDGSVEIKQNSKERTVAVIKEIIKKQENSQSTKYIRYSRNYEEVAQDSGFNWTTWYSVPKELIKESNDNFIFFTKVDGKYTGIKISGKNLNELIKHMKPSTEQNGKQTYDFYISEKSDGTYFENRHGIELGNYDVEKLNLDYLN